MFCIMFLFFLNIFDFFIIIIELILNKFNILRREGFYLNIYVLYYYII